MPAPKSQRAAKKASSSRSAPTRRSAAHSTSPSRLIDRRVAELGDWRGATLGRARAIIRSAAPGIVEEWKWENPVWSAGGIICTGETYRKAVKLTFAKGAALKDPKKLFNSSLEGNVRRAIDIHEGETIDARALTALVREAVRLNGAGSPANEARKPKLLSGGNPQMAKADGDAPVQAYIAAMPGWKRDVGRRLDALVTRVAPKARKAVKWNSPFYGSEGQGWFMAFHVYARFVKVSFFRGTSLRPVPPGGKGEGRWIDVHEDDLDEAQVAKWIKQAAALPGWDGSR